MKSLYRDEFVENMSEGMTEYFDNEVETLNMDIFAMLPVKLKGDDITRVLTWSVEDRLFQNGQKERHNLFEIYYIDEEGKLGGWNQWYRPNPNPEFTTPVYLRVENLLEEILITIGLEDLLYFQTEER